jgi:acetyl esterase/lipase
MGSASRWLTRPGLDRYRATVGAVVGQKSSTRGNLLGENFELKTRKLIGIKVTNMDQELDLIERQFGERDGRPLMTTIVRQAAGKNMPVLIDIHGGGWCAGVRENKISVMARDRANEGYLYLNIDYGLAPFNPYPAAIEDVGAAIIWAAKNAEFYGADPGRIGLIGLSAGGHLAVMLALTSPVPITCAVSWGGSMDFREANKVPEAMDGQRSCVLSFLGACFHERPDLYRAISPAGMLSEKSPPILIIHGENDPVIHRYHALAMLEAARQTGAPVDVKILRDAGHIDPGPFDEDGNLWRYICNFMAGHLKPSGQIRQKPTTPLATI